MKLAFKKLAILGLLSLAALALVGCDWFGTTTTTTPTTSTTTTTTTPTTTTTTPTTTTTTTTDTTATTTTTTTTATTTTTTTTVTLSDLQKVQEVIDALTLGDISAVSADLDLPNPTTNGVSVSWASADEDWITDDGEITIPKYTEGNQTIVMTATVSLNAASLTKEFSVVLAKESINTFLTRAGNAILITNADNMTANFTLTDISLGAAVTWVSGNLDLVTISATATGGLYSATVVRPKAEEGGTSTNVTLTATLTYDSQSIEVTKTVRIIAEPPATIYTSFETLHATASLNDYVNVTGIVYSTFKLGYFIVDDFGKYLAVYTSEANAALVHEGDEVRIKGKYAVYNTLYQLSSLTSQEILTTGNVHGVTPIVLANAADLLLVDRTNKLVHGQVYRITITPQLRGTYLNVYLFSGETQIATVYYNSHAASIDVLESFADQLITIDVVYYTFYSGSSVLVPGVPEVYITFDGAAGDVTIPELTDAQKLAAAQTALSIPTTAFGGQSLTLPAVGGYSSAITWAVLSGSEYGTIASGKLTFVDVAAIQSVTVQATITFGALTPVTKDFVIAVNPITTSTIAAAKALDPADLPFVQLEGTIYFIYTRGYYIQDATGTMNVYVNAVPAATLALGDKVIIMGTVATYKDQLQLASPIFKSEVSAENPYAQTPIEYIHGTTTFVAGNTYSVTATIFKGRIAAVDANNDNVYLMLGETLLGVIYYRSDTSSLAAMTAISGKEVTLNVVYYYHSNGFVYFVYQEEAEGLVLTEAQIAKDEVAALTINQSVTSNDVINLPVVAGTSTVSWALATTTLATIDGAVLTIGDAAVTSTITLTATITHPVTGGDPIVATKEFVITISTLEVKLTADQVALTVANQLEMSTLTLPTSGSNGSAIAWTLDASANASLALNVLTMNFKGSSYTLTLHATLTISTFTATKDFTITVDPVTVLTDLGAIASQSAGAWVVPNATGVYVRAFVAQVYGTSGWFLQDAAGNGLMLYQAGLTLAVGDEVVVYGNLVDYNTAHAITNRFRELVSASVKATLSTGNTIISTPMTAEQLAAVTMPTELMSKVVTATNLVVQGSDSSNFYLIWKTVVGETTVTYKLGFYKTAAPWFLDAFAVGETVPSIQFTVNSVASNGLTMYATNIGITMTDLQKAEYDAAQVPTTLAALIANYTLPTAKYLSSYSAVISAELTANLSFNAGVLVLVPPAEILNGTVTITVTNGTATQEVVIAVSLAKALTDAEKLALAIAELPSNMILYNGYTFPTLSFGATYGTIVISVELTSNLTNTAGVLSITRPASGAADVVGTVTVNVFVNAATDSKVINVTVKAYSSDLFISEYIEGGSNNKALEIYNDTGVDVDLATYSIKYAANGGTWNANVLALSGILVAGDVVVIINDGSDLAALLAVDDFMHGSICDFNGDDVTALFKGEVVIDSMGKYGFDPGDYYGVNTTVDMLDNTLVRIGNTLDSDITNDYTPVGSWVAYPQNTMTYIGSHSIPNIIS